MKTQEDTKPEQSPAPAKSRSKKFYLHWLLTALMVSIIIFLLLLHRPKRYNPPDTPHGNQVSPYLTHQLMPQFYNNIQHGEPFSVIISQEGINDIVRRSGLFRQSEDAGLSAPAVLFEPNKIVLMATANPAGAEFVVTIELNPYLDQQGLLNLQLAKIKLGAVNITPLAKLIGKRTYFDQLAPEEADTDDIGAQIAGSLLKNEPFEPVFKIEDKKVRLDKITITQNYLTLRFIPASY